MGRVLQFNNAFSSFLYCFFSTSAAGFAFYLVSVCLLLTIPRDYCKFCRHIQIKTFLNFTWSLITFFSIHILTTYLWNSFASKSWQISMKYPLLNTPPPKKKNGKALGTAGFQDNLLGFFNFSWSYRPLPKFATEW